MNTFRTLFSGGELFGIGARAAGWHHVDGYEIRPDIAAVARLNGFDVRTADVCAVDYSSLPPADHLHLGEAENPRGGLKHWIIWGGMDYGFGLGEAENPRGGLKLPWRRHSPSAWRSWGSRESARRIETFNSKPNTC